MDLFWPIHSGSETSRWVGAPSCFEFRFLVPSFTRGTLDRRPRNSFGIRGLCIATGSTRVDGLHHPSGKQQVQAFSCQSTQGVYLRMWTLVVHLSGVISPRAGRRLTQAEPFHKMACYLLIAQIDLEVSAPTCSKLGGDRASTHKGKYVAQFLVCR